MKVVGGSHQYQHLSHGHRSQNLKFPQDLNNSYPSQWLHSGLRSGWIFVSFCFCSKSWLWYFNVPTQISTHNIRRIFSFYVVEDWTFYIIPLIASCFYSASSSPRSKPNESVDQMNHTSSSYWSRGSITCPLSGIIPTTMFIALPFWPLFWVFQASYSPSSHIPSAPEATKYRLEVWYLVGAVYAAASCEKGLVCIL